ncbi:hypothetical protein Tco_0056996, partial [Tanacetum coccineum]
WCILGREYEADPDKGDLSAYWREISSAGDFLGTAPSYTSIRDPMLRHRLIACTISRRSQAPEMILKVVCFGEEARGYDIRGSFCCSSGRALGLLTKERLYGLTVIIRDLLEINMTKLVRLHICEELDDTWAWVAPRPKRQQVAAAGATKAAEDAPVVDEGALAVLAPMQVPQPPLPMVRPARTMEQRLGRRMTDDASTSIAQQDEQQPGP